MLEQTRLQVGAFIYSYDIQIMTDKMYVRTCNASVLKKHGLGLQVVTVNLVISVYNLIIFILLVN